MYGPGLGQYDDAPLGERVLAEIEAEAQKYIEKLFGRAYELIPDSIKREIESRYIQKRIAEEKARAVPALKTAIPWLIGGLVIFSMMRR